MTVLEGTRVPSPVGDIAVVQRGDVVVRTTFLIDKKGKISKIFPKVKVAGHAEEVLAALSQ